MKSRKLRGISPLIAVIILIAFTLIVAGILAGWATQFAQTQRSEVEFCVNARLILRSGDYDAAEQKLTLVVYNYGKVPLELNAILKYTNKTRHPVLEEIYGQDFNISENKIEAFVMENVTDDLEEVTVYSALCLGATDHLRALDISGL